MDHRQEAVLQAMLQNPQQMATMPHEELYRMRAGAPLTAQNAIAPYEHRAFAREAVGENPLMALPVAAGALAYQPYKMVMGSRSEPSLEQVMQAMRGVWEGLRK